MKTIEQKLTVVHNAIKLGYYENVTPRVEKIFKSMYNQIDMFDIKINPKWHDRIDTHYHNCEVLGIMGSPKLDENATDTEEKPRIFNHISTFTSMHTGGNVWVDVFELDDQTTIAITPESITLYRGMITDTREINVLDSPVLAEVDISRHGSDMDLREYVPTDGLSFVTELTEVRHVFKNIITVGDYIKLFNGIVIHIFTDTIDIVDTNIYSHAEKEIDSIYRPAIEGNPKAGEDNQLLDENAPSCPPPPPLTGEDSERYIRIYELFEELMKCTYDLDQEMGKVDNTIRLNAIIQHNYPYHLPLGKMTPDIINWCQSCIKELHRLK